MKLRDLPIGAVVRDYENQLYFLVAAQNHPGYQGTTLYARNVVEIGCLDGKEPDHAANPQNKGFRVFEKQSQYGWNDYGKSNLHQWLNATDADWYKPSHQWDTPPADDYNRYQEVEYLSRPGFLSIFSKTFIDGLLEVQVPVLSRVMADKGELSYVPAKVFAPSRTEIGKGDEWGIAEGKMFPLCYDYSVFKARPAEAVNEKYGRSLNPPRATAPYDNPQIYDPKYGWWYWVRTPSMSYTFLSRVASPYGALTYTFANNDSVGIRPVLHLDSDLEVEDEGGPIKTFVLVP